MRGLAHGCAVQLLKPSSAQTRTQIGLKPVKHRPSRPHPQPLRRWGFNSSASPTEPPEAPPHTATCCRATHARLRPSRCRTLWQLPQQTASISSVHRLRLGFARTPDGSSAPPAMRISQLLAQHQVSDAAVGATAQRQGCSNNTGACAIHCWRQRRCNSPMTPTCCSFNQAIWRCIG